jgi:hypothetical protein
MMFVITNSEQQVGTVKRHAFWQVNQEKEHGWWGVKLNNVIFVVNSRTNERGAYWQS